MNNNWLRQFRQTLKRSSISARRRPSRGRPSSVAAEVLESRTLLSGMEIHPAALADGGYYYWSGDEQVPLLNLSTQLSALSSSAPSGDASLTPTEFFSDAGTTRLWLTDQVYVRLDSASPDELFTAENDFSGYERVLGTTDQYVATVTAGAGESLAIANALHFATGVAFAHPNFVVEMQTYSNDSLYQSQWNLHNTGQTGGSTDADIDAPEAWAITTGSPDIVVAVLDVGTQLDHPDLVNSLFVNEGEIPGNGLDDDGNGWIDDVHGLDVAPDIDYTSPIEHDGDPSPGNEYDNHGTAVAGVIAAEQDNGIGISGVAPGVKIMPIRLGESGSGGTFSITVAGMAAAVYYAAGRTADGTGTWNGADVANHSYGTGSEIPALTDAFEWAAANGRDGLGLANFVSSGNGGGNSVSFPANLSTTIAVGATGDNDVRSSYSQYGTALDFVAPGGNGPDAGWIWTTDRTGSGGYGSGDYVGINGTSFSAPTAAGIAALMLSMDPTLTAEQVRQIMRDTADRDKVGGVTFDSNGFNLEYGYGWLNAEDAVIAAESYNGVDAVCADIVFQQSDGTWLVAASDGTQFTTTVWAIGGDGSIVWGDQVAGDFNGDGREDVAARNQLTGQWTVGISTGDSFTMSVWGSWTTLKTWGQVLAADFNGDGLTDIAGRIQDSGDGRWFVALSNGSGFQTAMWAGWRTDVQWGQVGAGDFNGDGRADIIGRVQTPGDGRWFVMLSDGSRFSMNHWQTWTTSVVWGPVQIGDFNGDGRTDIASQIQGANDGRWFLGLSTGSGFSIVAGDRFHPGSALSHLHVGDFDGDGDSEIAARLASDGRWFVLNLSDGNFTGQEWGAWSTATNWTNTVVGDFDEDGRSDIAGRNASTGAWQVALSDGDSFNNGDWGASNTDDWMFAAAGGFGGGWHGATTSQTCSDLPPANEGIVFQQSDGTWMVAASDGTQFTTTVWASGGDGSIVWGDQVAGDFNGDGREDVAARNQLTGQWTVGISTGDSFAMSVWGSWTTLKTWGQVLAADFNGDGLTDIAGRIQDSGDGRWFIALSNGSGFQTRFWGGWRTDVEWGQVGTGDFNGDGRADLIGRVQDAGDGRWFVMLSDGSRFSMNHWQTWSTHVAWGPVQIGDFNGDGRSDVAARVQEATDGRWFLGLSTGRGFSIVAGANFAPGRELSHLRVGDFDGDGDSEIAARLAEDGRWFVLNLSGGNFIGHQWGTWSAGTNWSDSVVGDFDGDGRDDIAGRDVSTGGWMVGFSTGSVLTSGQWGTTNPDEWQFASVSRFV